MLIAKSTFQTSNTTVLMIKQYHLDMLKYALEKELCFYQVFLYD